jgi:hypothetical protein
MPGDLISGSRTFRSDLGYVGENNAVLDPLVISHSQGEKMSTLRIPVQQYRSLPTPSGSSKLGLFSASASSIPAELWEWREVNPREVSTSTSVYTAIAGTLDEDPERFFERNRGITVSAADVEYDDKSKEVVISLEDSTLHGVVDGGHTLHAILEAQKTPPDGSWPAFVFVKVMTGIAADQIAEIAGGLNRSQQVDLKSLENLKGHFAQLQRVIAKEPYRDQIAFKMNESKPIDVREVLYYLAIFDASTYDETRHPTQLFGRKEGLVRDFAKEAAGKKAASFQILINRAPDILRLRDLIEKKTLTVDNIGRFKADKKARVKSPKHRKNELYFIGEQVDGKVPLGWIMPMLGAFRANVNWDQPHGSFSWKVDNEKLLDSCLQRLVSSIQEIHQRENRRPEHVGRSATAWRLCYQTVQNTILQHELETLKRA